jgi:hypothetical protein
MIDFADPAHGLRVGRHHRDRAEVVQDVLGGDGLAPDARFGEGHVLGDRRVEVVADHQHVEVLVERVDGVGRVGLVDDGSTLAWPTAAMMSGAWPPPAPSVWKVWMVRPLKAASVSLRGSRLVQRVGVQRDLHVHASATDRQLSIAAGVLPQSSCSLRPMAPASTCSSSGAAG